MPHYLPPVQLGEPSSRGGPGFGDVWGMEQQHRLQAFEVSKAQATWAAEFGIPSQISPGPSIQQNAASQTSE
jgi:hypothetical protein